MKSAKFISGSRLSLIIALTMVLSVLYIGSTPHVVKKAQAASTLASFDFKKSDGVSTAKDLNDTYNTKADSGYRATSGTVSSSYLFASIANPEDKDYKKLEWSKASDYSYNKSSLPETPIIAASTKNPWGTTPFFLIKTSASGYESLGISFRIGASKKGPRDFKVQYSTNGSSFTDISGSSFSLETNKVMYQHSYNLPASVANSSTLYIRIIATSTTTVEKGSTASDSKSGEIAINNISFTGTEAKKATQAPKATATPKPTQASKSTASPTKAPGSKSTAAPKDQTSGTSSNSDTNASSSGDSSSGDTSSATKMIKTLKLTSYKKGSKIIKGKTLKGATVHVSVGKKNYTAKASKKGAFKVTLSKKLKKKTTIKIYATKKGYSSSKTKSYTV